MQVVGAVAGVHFLLFICAVPLCCSLLLLIFVRHFFGPFLLLYLHGTCCPSAVTYCCCAGSMLPFCNQMLLSCSHQFGVLMHSHTVPVQLHTAPMQLHSAPP